MSGWRLFISFGELLYPPRRFWVILLLAYVFLLMETRGIDEEFVGRKNWIFMIWYGLHLFDVLCTVLTKLILRRRAG